MDNLINASRVWEQQQRVRVVAGLSEEDVSQIAEGLYKCSSMVRNDHPLIEYCLTVKQSGMFTRAMLPAVLALAFKNTPLANVEGWTISDMFGRTRISIPKELFFKRVKLYEQRTQMLPPPVPAVASDMSVVSSSTASANKRQRMMLLESSPATTISSGRRYLKHRVVEEDHISVPDSDAGESDAGSHDILRPATRGQKKNAGGGSKFFAELKAEKQPEKAPDDSDDDDESAISEESVEEIQTRVKYTPAKLREMVRSFHEVCIKETPNDTSADNILKDTVWVFFVYWFTYIQRRNRLPPQSVVKEVFEKLFPHLIVKSGTRSYYRGFRLVAAG
jgi:hypothetical protein